MELLHQGLWPAAESLSGDYSSGRVLPLLDSEQLFRAISGRSSIASPLVGWARELSDLYAKLISASPKEIQERPGFNPEIIRLDLERIIDEVDSWAVENIPRSRGARKHTHSLGQVISHVARLYANAWWAVLNSEDEELRHKLWFHLGEACEGYADMVNEIETRHLQLPLGAGGNRTT
ncbi:hypothetical protein ACWCPQ_29380 [Nocardia sp. NPDC001965]